MTPAAQAAELDGPGYWALRARGMSLAVEDRLDLSLTFGRVPGPGRQAREGGRYGAEHCRRRGRVPCAVIPSGHLSHRELSCGQTSCPCFVVFVSASAYAQPPRWGDRHRPRRRRRDRVSIRAPAMGRPARTSGSPVWSRFRSAPPRRGDARRCALAAMDAASRWSWWARSPRWSGWAWPVARTAPAPVRRPLVLICSGVW